MMTNLPEIQPTQRPMSRASDPRSLRESVPGSNRQGDARSVRSGVSQLSLGKGSKASETSSVVNLRRRQHLRSALVEKLLSKYYPGIANSKTEALINSEVEALIEQGRVTEQELRDAEARIRKQSNTEIAYVATNPFKLVVNHKSAHKDEWAQMNTNQAVRGLQKDKEQKRLNVERQAGFRRSLAEQLQEVEQRRAAEQLAKQAEAQKLAEDAHKYQMEQDQKMREHARKIEKMKRERDEQMKQVRRRREEAKMAVKAEGQAALEKLRQIQIEEAHKQREIKQQNLEKIARWKKENELSMAEKEHQKQLQIQKDQELIVKARLAADEAERKRLKELEELKAKMKAKEAIGEAMGADREAQMREDEARMIKAQEELRAKVNAELQAKKEAAEKMKVEIRKSLDKQMRDREARKKREAAELDKQARIDADKSIQARREAEQKEAERRAKMEEYRLQLEDQVRADVRDRPGRDRKMSTLERAMNVDAI